MLLAICFKAFIKAFDFIWVPACEEKSVNTNLYVQHRINF